MLQLELFEAEHLPGNDVIKSNILAPARGKIVSVTPRSRSASMGAINNASGVLLDRYAAGSGRRG